MNSNWKGGLFMKEKAKAKIEEEIKGWAYLEELQEKIADFSLDKKMKEDDDSFQIFSYENEEKKRSVNAYFHEETMEYKISVTIGLNSFCDVSFFASDIGEFEKNLRGNLENTVKNLAEESSENISSLIRDKDILSFKYEDILPENLEGFSLFITPQTPVLTINGSYIIIDYSNFSINSNFTIYYNIFRDEFFGESRINGTPMVSYDFDSKNLKELEEKLKVNMLGYLKEITERAKEEI